MSRGFQWHQGAYAAINKPFITVIWTFFILDGAFVCLQSGWQENKKPHGGRSHSRPEMFLSLLERFLITAIIKLPSYYDILYGERTSVSTATRWIWPSRLLDILWHCFFKCRSLITLPSGTGAEMWEYCVAACCWHFNRLYIAAAFPKHHPLVHCSCLSVPDMNMPPQTLPRTPTRAHAQRWAEREDEFLVLVCVKGTALVKS